LIEVKENITTAYKADNLGETKPSVVIGGTTEKFVPNLNMSFAYESGEEKFFINLNRSSVIVSDQKESLVTDKLALTTGNETDVWCIDEKGRLKWDIDFAEKPSTNVFEWDILHSEGLEFCYQPPLTQAEIDKGTIRAPEVVGSYAVYCDRRGHYKTADGKTLVNYATGKLTHIYRPLCRDAKGLETWAELLIEKGKLTITIPQKYLDEAVYPVTLDPTFGYTTMGASSGSSDHSAAFPLSGESPSGGGTLTNLSAWVISSYNPTELYFAIYSDSSGIANNRLVYDTTSFTTPGNGSDHVVTNEIAWTYSMPSTPTQYHGATFYVSGDSGNSPGDHFHYDDGGGKTNIYAGTMTPPATISGWSTDYSNKYFSVWATYEVLAGASAVITGTATASINESDIVNGGKTVIITLTGDTWIAP
jgi:hypothetical protein